MSQRRVIVGAIGGDKQKQAAYDFGRAVAQAGCILLTGGNNIDDDEVKNASARGASEAERGGSATARFVGILPSHSFVWEQHSAHWLLLHTGLMHNIRNAINGLTPDVVVAFGGSRGTLAEVAFAAISGKKLFFYGGSERLAVRRLQSNYKKYLDSGDQATVNFYLGSPLAAFPNVWKASWTSAKLSLLLGHLLEEAEDWSGTASELVNHCIEVAREKGISEKTGFPGLPNDPSSKSKFEAFIARMSVT